MPHTLTPERPEFLRQRRFLSIERPHSFECFKAWAATVTNLNTEPITTETTARRELAVEMRDSYALNIIKSFDSQEVA